MKMLDFNALQQPTWAIKLKDDDRTVVTLTVPSVELVDRVASAAPELKEVVKTKDERASRAVYELVADIMGCNEEGLKFTADELLAKYRMQLIDMIAFMAGYMEFIAEIQNAKN